jgi:hypothetical protein
MPELHLEQWRPDCGGDWCLSGPGYFANYWPDNTVSATLYNAKGEAILKSGIFSGASRAECQAWAERWIRENWPTGRRAKGKVPMFSTRILRTHEIERSNGNVVVIELIKGLRALIEEAQRRGPVTVADVESIRLEISRSDILGTEHALRVDFRMTKEVAE